MPRITIENEKEIGGGVSEIVPVTYELPEKIVVGKELLYWDSHFQGYWSRTNETFISGKDYLTEILKTYKAGIQNQTGKGDEQKQ